jgi:hypothetical protein
VTRIIAVDWSGDFRNAAKKIWTAEVSQGGAIVRLECGRDRQSTAEWLISQAARPERLIVGLDFAFSLPAWFCKESALTSAPDLWALADREAESWLLRCEQPFWGRPGKKKPMLPEHFPHFRRTELAAPSTAGIRPKSVFQIGGAGAVGTGSLRGLPVLHRLRNAGFSIWPFDLARSHTVVEIYPRLLTGPVVKSDPVKCNKYLAAEFPQLHSEERARMAASEDAFDAAVSALIMARHTADLLDLPAARDEFDALEGRIWHPSLSRTELELPTLADTWRTGPCASP